MPFRFLKRREMTATRFAGFWSTRNNHGLKQPASYSCDLCYYSSSPRTRRTVTVSRNTWFQRCLEGSGIGCQSRQGEERCCRMAPHGDSLCVDVLLCLIAQPGRQAGQPNHRQRVRSPLTAPAVKDRFWLRKQRSPLTAPTVKDRFWLRKQPPHAV